MAAAPTVSKRHAPEPESQRCVFDPQRGAWIEAAGYDRAKLSPGARIAEPAIIVEAETSTLVGNGFSATINGLGQIVLVKSEGS